MHDEDALPVSPASSAPPRFPPKVKNSMASSLELSSNCNQNLRAKGKQVQQLPTATTLESNSYRRPFSILILPMSFVAVFVAWYVFGDLSLLNYAPDRSIVKEAPGESDHANAQLHDRERVWKDPGKRLGRRSFSQSVHNRSSKLRDSSGTQHDSANSAKLNTRVHVVVARTQSDDKEWLEMIGNIPYTLYTESMMRKDDAPPKDPHEYWKPLTTTNGSTRECGGYLSYMVDNYDTLPEVTIFLQGRPLARSESHDQKQHIDWHSDAYIMQVIYIIGMHPEKVKYCSLNKFRSNWLPADKRLYPWYYRDVRKVIEGQEAANFAHMKNAIVPPMLQSPHGAGCFCCAQFAVSRERIRMHPKVVYEQLLRYVLEEPTKSDKATLNFRCAQLERLWHMLFGEPAMCPKELFCRYLYEGRSALAAVKD